MILSKCAVCDNKKLTFLKEQDASRLLSTWGIRSSLRLVPLVGPLLFQRYKMNEIVNKLLSSGDEFIPEVDLRQPWCDKFIKLINHVIKTKKKYKN